MISVIKMVVFFFFFLTEITISLTSSIITVPESESVQVSIVVFGFPDINPFSFRSPLEAFILLYTSDGSALGRHHYNYHNHLHYVDICILIYTCKSTHSSY